MAVFSSKSCLAFVRQAISLCLAGLVLTMGCAVPPNGNESTQDDDSSTLSTADDLESFVKMAWDEEVIQQLNTQLRNLSFQAATDQPILLFEDSDSKGVLVPYYTTQADQEAAIVIIEDHDGIDGSATIITKNQGEVEAAQLLKWDGQAIETSVIMGQTTDGVYAYHSCGGDKWCCFVGCMIAGCGGTAVGCWWLGPAYWSCLLAGCGATTFTCYWSCY